MSVASLELSRTLFELSGWGNTHLKHNIAGGLMTAEQSEMLTGEDEYFVEAPAYDLGYLLRRLPTFVDDFRFDFVMRNLNTDRIGSMGYSKLEQVSRDKVEGFRIVYHPTIKYQHGDSLEDAACKLAIELFKQNILAKENA